MAPINQLRVEIDTDAASGAGTANRVFFDIGTRQWQLDNVGEDDFLPGATDTFDLVVNSALDTSDIRRIRLEKKSFDDWRPSAIRVSVNGAQIYGGPIDVRLDQGDGAQQNAGLYWQAGDFPERVADVDRDVTVITVILTTSPNSLAGTDNQVFFSVGTREWQLETPDENDFEPGSTRTYFIRDIENLKMDQITEIGLRKVGTDGWLPEEILVWINDDELVGGPTYDRVINQWLDGGAGARLEHGLTWVAPDYPQPTPVSTDPAADIAELEVRVRTSSRRYSATDDPVFFDIGTREWLLDDPVRNDFEQGNTDTFSLVVPAGLQRSDFRKISLRKAADNGWRPDHIEVFLNGSATPFYVGDPDLFLDAGADARNKYGQMWTARDFIREIPVVCWNVIGDTDDTIRPGRTEQAATALIDNRNTAGYRTGAGSANGLWAQAQMKFRVVDFRELEVPDANAQMMPDSTSADRTAMGMIGVNNNVDDAVNVYFVRATATGSNWQITRQGVRSIWVQDTRGGQTVNTRANFERVAVSLAHEIGHYFGLPHICDDADGDPCTAAEQALLMTGDGTDQTSVQITVAEAMTAYGNAAALAE